MKILVIDDEFPHPLNTGKRIRSFHLVRALAAKHRVTYMAYGNDEAAMVSALSAAGMIPLAVPAPERRKSGARFYGRLLANLVSPEPYIVTSQYSDSFMSTLEHQVAAGYPDLVLCEWNPHSRFLRSIRGPKKILVAHNSDSRIWRRYHAHEENPLKRWYISRQLAKIRRFERRMVTWFDGIIAVSEGEAEEIRSFGGQCPVAVVENGVDADYFQPGTESEDGTGLVFTGSMDWRPNQDAAQHFVREIWPLLRRERPSLTASFVGRNPPPEVMRLGEVPGITITGTVPDVRPLIRAAAVYIVPLRIGGGSRLKILEALAMGKAVVTTTIGAEGLRVRDGHEVVLADTPEAFAAAVQRLLDDRSARQNLGAAGRSLIEAHYRWESLGAQLERILCDVVGEEVLDTPAPSPSRLL